MNALMTIQVRVLSAGALAQLRALETQSARTATGGIGAMNKQAGLGIPRLSKWGNQVQWAGRQLMYNFTLPIALAIGMATKFALENEKAMTRVIKVYGDGSKEFRKLSKTEIPALDRAMGALSNRFGVQRSLVIGIAGDWAAAGASGIALAKSVKLTLETMILGELDAAEATKQLIAIQAQYGQNTTQLSKTIDILNMVENQTGASMKDLMDAMSRSAGVARVAGVDVEHLAAMTAALVPAAGSAANAGNALKTIISRILSPTKEATDLLREMGVQVDAQSWNSLNATQRIEQLSKSFEGLSSAQKAHMATVLGSRWQLNKLVILMQAVRNENSYYNKSLKATTDTQKMFRQRQFELNKVLQSNPQKMKQIWVILQNAMADVIQPLIPFIVYLGQQVAALATWFSHLDGNTQKLVLALAVFLALIGPIARYVGAVANLFGLLGSFIRFVTVGFIGFNKVLLVTIARLLLLPFLPVIAGLKLLGPAAVAAGRLMIAGFAPVAAGIFTALMIGIRAFAAPFIAMWRVLLVELQVLWAVAMVSINRVIAVGQAALRVLWVELMVALRVVSVAGWAAITAAWNVAMFILLGTSLAVRTTTLTIWGVMMKALTLVVAGGGAALVRVWAAVMTGMTLITTIGMRAIGLVFLAARALPMLFVVGVGRVLMAIPAMLMALASGIFTALMSPWVLASVAIVGVIVLMKDKIADGLNNLGDGFQQVVKNIIGYFAPVGDFFHSLGQGIMDAFWALPEGVRNAMIAVLNVIVAAAKQIYEWMSYLNPFARHSPSLVDQVDKGMDQIGRSYENGSRRAAKATKGHDAHKVAIAAQQRVVDRWKNSLDKANNSLDIQQAKLSSLQDRLSAVQEAYDAHKDSLNNYAQAPIKGMGLMEDAIFSNEMAQKKLRLEMLKMEEVNGSIDSIRSKIDALTGDIEVLRGNAEGLRQAGAGSEVLGPIQSQIAQMEAARRALEGTAQDSPLNEMQNQMDKLSKQGEILDLEKSIKFDGLLRNIDKLADSQKELTYDQIINGINRERAAMNKLQPQLDSLSAAVKRQEAIVKSATASRDAIQRRYDKESALLAKMKRGYDELSGSIKKAAGLKSPGQAVETFRAGKGANWADVGGKAKIGREGGMGDQSALIDQFAKDTAADMGNMFGSFDMWAPIKKKWHDAWAWLKQNVGPVLTDIKNAITSGLKNIGIDLGDLFGGGKVSGWLKPFQTAGKVIGSIIGFLVKHGKRLWALFGDDIVRAFKAVVKAGKRLWTEVGPDLIKTFKELWPIIKVVAKILGGALLLALKVITAVLSRALGPAFDLIIDIIKNVLRIIRGFAQIIKGIFTGDLTLILKGVGNIFRGLVQGIWSILKNGAKLIWAVVSGIVHGIVDFFVWLFNKIIGHSIIPDLVNGVIRVFKLLAAVPKWIWNHLVMPVVRFFKKLWDKVGSELREWWGRIKNAWGKLKDLGKWVWDHSLGWLFNTYKNLWKDRVKPELAKWWSRITSIWAKLKELGGWIKKHVMDPIFDKIKSGWERVKTWLTGAKDILMRPVKGIVNAVIKGVNKLISGVNKISDVLPGISFHISAIPTLAKGGIPTQRVKSGFMTSGARAIVGEGKPNHPEFVIPTDPTYRTRARSLLTQAGKRLGMFTAPVKGQPMGDRPSDLVELMKNNPKGGLPFFGIGGVIGGLMGKAKDLVKGAGSWAVGNLHKIGSTLAKPFFNIAKSLIDKVGWNIPRSIGKYLISKAEAWVGGVDEAAFKKTQAIEKASGGDALKWAKTQVGKPYVWGGVGPGGYDCSGFMSAITNVIRGKAPHSRIGSTASFPWGGFIGGYGGKFSIGSTKNYGGSGVGHMAGTLGGTNVESAGGVGVRVGSSARGARDGGFSTIAHLFRGGNIPAHPYYKMGSGGIIKASRYGTFIQAGEAGRDEAVVPLPRGGRPSTFSTGSDNSRTTHIHIDKLELPNITTGEDAQTLIDNLEILARD